MKKSSDVSWSPTALDLVLIAVSIYSLLDSLAPRGVLAWQPAFAGFFSVTFGVALILVLFHGSSSATRPQLNIFFAALVFWLFGFLGVANSENVIPRYVIGDSATSAMIVLFIFILCQGGGHITKPAIQIIVLSLGLGVVLAGISGSLGLFPEYSRAGGRFDSPHILLVSIVIAFCAMVEKPRKYFAYGLLLVLLLASFLSGWRSYFLQIILVVSLAASIFARRSDWPRIAMVLFFGIPAVVILSWGFLTQTIAESRFSTIANLEMDDSAAGRLNEAIDVFRIARESSSSGLLFGHGHGATYRPVFTQAERNLVEGNLVHHIHIGPVMIFFRYGFMGLLAYCYVIIILAWDLFFNRIRLRLSPYYLILFLSCSGTMFASLFVNIFNEPLSVLIIATYLVARLGASPNIERYEPTGRSYIYGHRAP